MTILLIDDDEVGLRVRQQLLEVSGYSVIAALSGGAGLVACKDVAIDLAVIDYQLPDMSGELLIAELRELAPRAPVILLSGQMAIPPTTLAAVDATIVKGEAAKRLLDTIATYARATRK